jgi:hypothetical protein
MKSFNLQATLVVQLPGEVKKYALEEERKTHSHYNI